MKTPNTILAGIIAACVCAPALAEVKPTNATSFASSHIANVSAEPDALWKRILAPKDWWNPDHSWSGSTAGFYIDAQAGGCFCELFQTKDNKGQLKTTGSVEHMRVIYAQPGKVLRMQGALGPLQSEAVLGTLTVAIEANAEGGSSKISFNYVVSGHTRFPPGKIASAVDAVIAEQFARLIAPYGGKADQPANDIDGEAAPKEQAKPGATSLDLGDIDQKAADETAPMPPAQPGA